MFKFSTILMVVVLMAVLSLSTVVTYAQVTDDTMREVSLTPEQSMRILDLQAVGKIVEADSLKRVFLNQIFLDNAAADSVLSARNAERAERQRNVLMGFLCISVIAAIVVMLKCVPRIHRP